MIRIEFEASDVDLRNARAIHQSAVDRAANPFQSMYYGGYVVTGIGLILLVDQWHAAPGSWIAPALLMAVGLLVTLRLTLIALAQRSDSQAAYDRIGRPCIWEFHDDRLSFHSPLIEGSMRWEAYQRWREGSAVFLLYRSDDDYTFVPKRAFADERQIIEFRNLLRAKIDRPKVQGFPVQPVA